MLPVGSPEWRQSHDNKVQLVLSGKAPLWIAGKKLRKATKQEIAAWALHHGYYRKSN